MADVTTLGIAVDSSGVTKATEALERMAGAADKGATAATGVDHAATGMAGGMTGAIVKGNILADVLMATARFAFDATKRMFELAVELGRFQDMAEMTQADPAGLASMQVAADVAGVSMETVTMSMNRLSNVLAGVEDDGKAAGKALQAIGIEIEAFKKLGPDEQYRKVAVALEGYATGQGKVAVTQALMGRGSGQQLRLMHELATETERSTIVTKDIIKEMDDFSDANARTASQMRQMIGVMMSGSVPALKALKETAIGAVESLLSLGTEAGQLALQGGIKEFADGAATSLGFLVDVIEGPIRLLRVLSSVVTGITAAAFAKSNAEAKGILADMVKTTDAILMELSFGQKLAERLAAARATKPKAVEPEKPKPKLDFNPNAEESGAKAKQVYNELMLSLQKKLDLEREELALGRKLTEEEKLHIEVLAQVKRSKQDMSAAQMKDIDGMLTAIGLVAKDLELREKRAKADAAYAEELRGLVNVELQRRDALITVREQEEQALANYGKSVVALQDLQVARMRDAAATLRQAAVMAGEYNPEAATQVRLLGEQATQLEKAALARERFDQRERADRGSMGVGARRAVEEYLDSVADVARATQQVVGGALRQTEDMMTDLFTGKKVDVHAFIETIIAEFTRLAIVRPLMASIFGGGGGGGFASLLGLFGGGAGMASTGAELSTAAGMAIGTFAVGGRPPVNEPSWVGERGAELFVPDRAGTIIPNNKLNGGGKQINFSPTTIVNVDSRADIAQTRQLIESASAKTSKAMLDELKARGVF